MIKRALAVQTAADSWEGRAPEWVRVLARRCDELESQTLAAEEIGYSAPAVNQVLRNRYRGNLGKVESAVREVLMGDTVMCPVLGEILVSECKANQKRPFNAANALRVQLFRACSECKRRNHERQA